MKKLYLAVLGAASVAFSSMASAAIDATTHLAPVKTEIEGDISTVITWAIPIIGVALAASIGIKLFKRFGNKV